MIASKPDAQTFTITPRVRVRALRNQMKEFPRRSPKMLWFDTSRVLSQTRSNAREISSTAFAFALHRIGDGGRPIRQDDREVRRRRDRSREGRLATFVIQNFAFLPTCRSGQKSTISPLFSLPHVKSARSMSCPSRWGRLPNTMREADWFESTGGGEIDSPFHPPISNWRLVHARRPRKLSLFLSRGQTWRRCPTLGGDLPTLLRNTGRYARLLLRN